MKLHFTLLIYNIVYKSLLINIKTLHFVKTFLTKYNVPLEVYSCSSFIVSDKEIRGSIRVSDENHMRVLQDFLNNKNKDDLKPGRVFIKKDRSAFVLDVEFIYFGYIATIRNISIEIESINSRSHIKAIAHELKNSLGIISTHAGFVKRHSSEKSISVESMKNILSSCSHMQNIINREIREKSSGIYHEKADIIHSISQVVREFNVGTDEVVSMRKNIDSCFCIFDEVYLRGMIINLIRNSMAATSLKEKPFIKVSIDAGIKYISISVLDNGKGFSRTLDSTKWREYINNTTSLGLKYVYNAVRIHDGSMNIITGSKGTEFHINIPMVH